MLSLLSLLLLASSGALAAYALGIGLAGSQFWTRSRAARQIAALRLPGSSRPGRDPTGGAGGARGARGSPRSAAVLGWARNFLVRAGLPPRPELLLVACAGSGLLVARLAAPLQNPPFSALAAAAAATAPLAWVRSRVTQRTLGINQGVGEALTQLSRLAKVRRHPYLALADAIPSFPHPLKPEYEQALHEYRAGQPLGECLRSAAQRLGGNYYLVQVAELADLSLQHGSDFGVALGRLLDRHRLTEELRAEERTQLHGYSRLTWILFLASQAPVVWVVLRHSPDLHYFVEYPVARLLLVWNLLSGLLVAGLPALLSYDET